MLQSADLAILHVLNRVTMDPAFAETMTAGYALNEPSGAKR